MQKELQTKHGQRIYYTNPSVEGATTIVKRRPKQIGDERKGLLLENTGNIIGPGAALMYTWEEVDKEQFVKLFLAGFKQSVGMTKAGMQVFELVYDQMRERRDEDVVALAAATSGLSQSTFSRGLRELVTREFIYRSPNPGLFWVNIRYIFNGDRLAFLKGYQLKGGKGTKSARSRQLGLFHEQQTEEQE